MKYRILTRILILFAVIGVIWLSSYVKKQNRIQKALARFRDSPVNDPSISGVEFTMKQAEHLYFVMSRYRELHGKFPCGADITDAINNYSAYGYKKTRDAMLAFHNKDNVQADNFFESTGPEDYNPFMMPCSSQTGKPDEVLAFTEIYFHRRKKHILSERKMTVDPTGFFIIVWGDGRIEKIDWTRVRWTLAPSGQIGTYFPGQANQPADGMDFMAFWKAQEDFGATPPR